MKHNQDDTIPVCVRLPKARVAALKRLARERAVELDRDVHYTDFIRQALEQAYPPEAQTGVASSADMNAEHSAGTTPVAVVS